MRCWTVLLKSRREAMKTSFLILCLAVTVSAQLLPDVRGPLRRFRPFRPFYPIWRRKSTHSPTTTPSPTPTSCQTSAGCGEQHCCRDANGRHLSHQPDSFDFVLGSGTCVAGFARPGENCDSTCDCRPGYTCYRTITGACCPPKTCWNAEEARRDKEFWDNCRPPNCQFPPVAPPRQGPL